MYLLKKQAPDDGVLLGNISELPMQPAFVLQALLSNGGYNDIAGLAIVHGERQPSTRIPQLSKVARRSAGASDIDREIKEQTILAY